MPGSSVSTANTVGQSTTAIHSAREEKVEHDDGWQLFERKEKQAAAQKRVEGSPNLSTVTNVDMTDTVQSCSAKKPTQTAR